VEEHLADPSLAETTFLLLNLWKVPFDVALVEVKEWFAELPISQQSQVLEALESANDVDTQPVAA
jgi:hypothetical protein